MRRNLQSKFNLLGVTLIVFALLMLPMFNQVKADTRDSLKEAKNTWMSKAFREMARDFKPRNLENTEVEDYWAEQAKKQDPDCGEACDPNADRDGDGMSNADEVRAGRNPSCNEEKRGHDYCKDQDPYNLTDEDPVVQRVERTMIANITWLFSNCSPQPIPSQCGTRSFDLAVPVNASRIESYLNATDYSGQGYTITVRNGSQYVYQHPNLGGFQPTPRTMPMDTRSVEGPPPGQYNGQLTFNPSAQSGTWNLQVWVLRVVN